MLCVSFMQLSFIAVLKQLVNDRFCKLESGGKKLEPKKTTSFFITRPELHAFVYKNFPYF